MPLLYRVLMRLAAVVGILGGLLGFAFGIANASDFGGGWPLAIVVGLLPAAALYAIAWVIRPPLDRASLRRLWRE